MSAEAHPIRLEKIVVSANSSGVHSGSLPPRLGDPLAIARILAWIGLILSLIGCGITGASANGPDQAMSGRAVLQEILGLVFMVFVLRTLPYRRTNAFYLRSFRKDDDTAQVRQVIQQTLGRSFRLSGIRDPRRRMSTFMKYAINFIYCLKYSTTRHMNLEAGDDWFARLWRSLGDARCAFVDLTDLTDYVAQEVELVYRSLGPTRVLLLGDQTREPEALRALVAERLRLTEEEAAKLWVATWDRGSKSNTAGFRQSVAEFAAQLPASAAGVCHSTYTSATATYVGNHGVGGVNYGIQAILGFLALPLFTLFMMLGALGVSQSGFTFAWMIAAVAVAVLAVGYTLFSLVTYFLDCGSPYERAITSLFMCVVAVVTLLMVGSTLASVQRLREAANRMSCGNNLKQIELAMGNYESSNGRFPPAYKVGPDGKSRHSWRILILPYLEHDALYKEYKFDEPWDAPNNSKLAERMPSVYRHPNDDLRTLTTSYMAVTGRDTAFGNGQSPRLAWISDGLWDTISIVEAPDKRVHWMEPTDLDADEFLSQMEDLRTRQAGRHSGGINAAFFDAHVEFLSATLKPSVLRALTTCSSGDVAKRW